MWKVVYITSDHKRLTQIQDFLQKEGLFVRLRELAKGTNASYTEVMVTEAEAEEATELLNAWVSRHL